jgi:hypothetical protein
LDGVGAGTGGEGKEGWGSILAYTFIIYLGIGMGFCMVWRGVGEEGDEEDEMMGGRRSSTISRILRLFFIGLACLVNAFRIHYGNLHG